MTQKGGKVTVFLAITFVVIMFVSIGHPPDMFTSWPPGMFSPLSSTNPAPYPSECDLMLERQSENITDARRKRKPPFLPVAIFQKDEQCAVSYVRKFELHQPSNLSHNLTSPRDTYFSQAGQDRFVDHLLGSRRNGFFLECGAGDGEHLSNSLFFERERGWTGLLVEGHAPSFTTLKSKHRKAWSVNTCLSTSGSVQHMQYMVAGLNSAIKQAYDHPFETYLQGIGQWKRSVAMQCYPLHVLLQAVNQTHVDYFSLDIEGGEIDVIKSIHWNKVTIDVLTVEFRILKASSSNNRTTVDVEETKKKFLQVQDAMLSTGLYEVAGTLPKEGIRTTALDMVFKRKNLGVVKS